MKLLRTFFAMLALAIASPVFAADVAISALPSASTLVGTETFPGVQGTTTVKITPAQVRTYLLGTASTWTAAQTFVAPLLGTPASGVATNLTGTASGLTAGTATVAVGAAAQTGTGSTFVMQSSPTINTPTFVAPALGTPVSGVLTNATGLPAAGVVGTAAILGANTFTGTQTFSVQILARGTLDAAAPQYSFSGDAGTGWGWRSSGTLSAYSLGGEKFRVASNLVSVLGFNFQLGAATKGLVFNSADNTGGTDDAAIYRNAAGRLEISTGTKGTYGDLTLRQLYPDFTNTATVGAVTINKAAGKAIVGTGTTSTVVTNSLVTANSQVICTVNSNDATATLKNCTPGAGSFTITTTAAATADTNVAFIVFNQ